MTNKSIMKKLQKHLDYAKQIFNEDKIVGIFLYGSQNYNLSTPTSDVDSILVILPSFDDLLFNKTWYSKELYLEDEHIVVKDIRCYREELLKQNINYLETLFGESYILNNKYKDLFKMYFFDNKDLIGNYNNYKMKKAVAGQLYNTLKQAKNNNEKEDKKLANCFRLRKTLDKIGEPSLENIIALTEKEDIKYAMSLKTGKANQETKDLEYKLCEDAAAAVFAETDTEDVSSSAALEVINRGVSAIMKLSLVENEDKPLTKEEFFKQLTHAEERAFMSIIDSIGSEGNITISKLVDKYGISRPVYNNLIKKMKENKVAEVLNMGMKGTYIKIINPLLEVHNI